MDTISTNGSSSRELLMLGQEIQECDKREARRVYLNVKNTKRYKEKVQRYRPKAPPAIPTCTHARKLSLQCSQVSESEAREFHKSFYALKTKELQDALILKHIGCLRKVNTKQLARKKKGKRFSALFFIRTKTNEHRVCRATFCSILQVGNRRVQAIAAHYYECGKVRIERRGGDRKAATFAEKEASVSAFIRSLKAVESHYSRDKSRRVYLAPNLNVNKLWHLYNEKATPELQVKRSFFRRVFLTRFNIGFGSPLTDACSLCIQLGEKIAAADTEEAKNKLRIDLRVHKLRGRSFFELLRYRNPDTLTLRFDCEKNLVLPKVPDQAAYYSRQLYLYNLGVVQLTEAGEIPRMYTWRETDRPKSSNEIASAVYHALDQAKFDGLRRVRLCADGCAGQNKNTSMVFMAAYWLLNSAPESVEELQLIFPIVGHSFLPADRLFGRIEQQLRRLDTIVEPEQYLDVLRSHGTVYRMGTDYPVYDWKRDAHAILKGTSSFHFKISECRRLILRCTASSVSFEIRGETNYRLDTGIFGSIVKHGKNMSAAVLADLPLGVGVKEEKMRDVRNLLQKHFGEAWLENAQIAYYRDVLNAPELPAMNEDEQDECLCMHDRSEVDI